MAQLNDTMVQGDLRVTGKVYGTDNVIYLQDANLAIPPLGIGYLVGSTGDFFIGSGIEKNLPDTTNNFNIHTTVTHFNGTIYRLSQIATPTASTNPTGIYERGGTSSDGITWTFGSWASYNNYTLPLAASGTRGGIQIGYSESGTNYAVKLSSEKAYVSVPWTDTKVKQTADNSSTGTGFEVLFSATGDNTTRTEGSRKSNKLTFQPSTGTLTATKFSGPLTGNAATATKATQDADGNNIKATYMKASSGDKNLYYGLSTIIGTVNGSNVNLVMPAANADVFEVNANSTSFSEALSAYNDGKKKLVLLAGKQGTGSFVTQYEIPLYRVVLNGTTITQFVWIASDDAYNEASDSNTFGAIMYYKLSSSGWDIGIDNIAFASVAGRTIGDAVSATANSALTWGASVQNLLLTKSSGEVTVDVKNLIVGQVYWLHAGRALKVKFKNSAGACTMYAYGSSGPINNVDTFDIQDNPDYSKHGSFSVAVIHSSETVYYAMMGYGDAH
jgi:hypothetical protein